MSKVAIIAAMPGELQPLVCGWEHERRNGVELWRRRFDRGEWIAACAGAGQRAATRAFAACEMDGKITSAISVGWVGALSEDFKPGRAYRVAGVVDSQTGERFDAEIEPHPSDKNKNVARVGHPEFNFPRSQNRDLGHPDDCGCLLATSPKVADAAEKQRLASAYGADLVDMEAAAVARLAAMRGLPFFCFKGVSDGFTENLPDFNRFMTPDGQFLLNRLLFYVLPRPWCWPALIRMGENSKRASRSIAESLLDFLDDRGQTRKRNGN